MERVSIHGRRLMLYAGFEIALPAGPLLVERPTCAEFDEEGRLYSAEGAGTSDKIDDLISNKPHRILRLEDVDGDSRFDRRTIFADGLAIPRARCGMAVRCTWLFLPAFGS